MLVEREGRLEQLRALYREALGGRGRAGVVSGPVGSGKTELLHAFARDPGGETPLHLLASATRSERGVPLGVIRQLMPSVGRDDDPHETALRLLDVIEQSAGPVLISVDDAHLADALSLTCLAAVMRRIRTARVLVLLTYVPPAVGGDPLLAADLPPEPFCARVPVGLLSQTGVAALVGTAQDVSAVRTLTGGNPRLVRALLELSEKRSNLDKLARTTTFGQALVSILHRCEPATLRTARALAVLGAPTRPVTLSTLTGLDTQTCARALRALAETGLLVNDRFAHEALPAAVLRAMPADELSVLYAAAAPLLYADGAPPRVVARSLLAGNAVTGPWAISLLHEAAEQALTAGESEEAVRCLTLARELATEDGQRHASTVLLIQAEWQADPAAAGRHLTAMVEAASSHALSAGHTLAVVDQLLWFGRVEEAIGALSRLTEMQDLLTPAERKRLYAAEVWLSCLFPAAEGHAGPSAGGARGGLGPEPALESARMMSGLVSQDEVAVRLTDAERALQRRHLDERTVFLCANALLTLTYRDRLEDAQQWCERLMSRAATPGTRTWHALFTALAAEICFRRGDLAGAVGHARAALDLIPLRSWGIRVAVPLGILVQAQVALGDIEAADAALHLPVSEAMFQSPIGLYYLQARGCYLATIGRHPEALEEFRMIGELLEQWHIEPAPFMTWRIDMAWVYLAMGRPAKARELANEEMERTPLEDARARARCLRVLAATADVGKQVGIYEHAVEVLRACDAPLELAYTLAEFADALERANELPRAAELRDRARRLAQDCGVADPEAGRGFGGPAAGLPEPGATVGGVGAMPALSEAEHRVAALASAGYSNRQIAKKLFVTISTVEQHLTRVYRKLGVSRRSQLAGAYPSVSAAAR
ncbi:LuxR C-terminal-related transcriptional regulator [Streptomyces sp. NPDC102360]|uniref:helix-turn-helix transcriptional regulator n=1 Tax=Streptomyces sp. NPDC102360 TaxID=3366160 RepID=UPI0038115A28